MESTYLKNQPQNSPVSTANIVCERCGQAANVLYWNREEQKWLCKECQFRKEKKSK